MSEKELTTKLEQVESQLCELKEHLDEAEAERNGNETIMELFGTLDWIMTTNEVDWSFDERCERVTKDLEDYTFEYDYDVKTEPKKFCKQNWKYYVQAIGEWDTSNDVVEELEERIYVLEQEQHRINIILTPVYEQTTLF